MKIFDCTTFYNENLMLEIRFNILNKYVDKFVIVEAKYSHSGEKKKLNFDINRFKDFKNKIIYLVSDKEPENLLMGCSIEVTGKLVESPAAGQKYELQVQDYTIGKIIGTYPFGKKKNSMDKLRMNSHLRPRMAIFGCVFRIRNAMMWATHQFYQSKKFLLLDPNILTINECEGGAGTFRVLEGDGKSEHFQQKAFLTVSSQLQLEAMACSMGNVYTMNKSFRAEHSSTNKHVSEFTHLEIEMIYNSMSELMDNGEEYIKYVIQYVLEHNMEDLEGLNRFVSKGIIDKLESIPGYRTQLSLNEFKKIVLDVGISIMCQTDEICPADQKIYALRDVTKTVASNSLICGSILSKKIAEGIEGLILDIKVGNGAFMKSMDAAIKLGQLLGKVGKKYGINISICYTSMEQPLGNNCGLWCEIMESLDCLKGRGPKDIMDVVFYLGDKALKLAGYRDVKKKMIQCIEDRSALNIFLKMIENHGGNIKSLYNSEYNKPLFLKKYKIDKVGYIKSIDTRKIGNALVKLGCGRKNKNDKLDFTAGIQFNKKIGDFIKFEDTIFEYFCSNQSKINQVQKLLEKVIILDVKQTGEPDLILS